MNAKRVRFLNDIAGFYGHGEFIYNHRGNEFTVRFETGPGRSNEFLYPADSTNVHFFVGGRLIRVLPKIPVYTLSGEPFNIPQHPYYYG